MAQTESTPGKSIAAGSVTVAASQISTQQNLGVGVIQPSTIAVLTTVTPTVYSSPGARSNQGP